MKYIDLRSDTVTKPSVPMLEYMIKAEVGDDVFEEDPTVKQLENEVAALLGKEAAIFCPSGTMANQIALQILTHAPGEIICDRFSHIYLYEGGGLAYHARLSMKVIHSVRGIFDAQDVIPLISPQDLHFPSTQAICIENTCNRGGGSVWPLAPVQRIYEVARQHGIALHLDGARLFNACHEADYIPSEFCQYFDTVTICLSKGLGAPIGSLLCGSFALMKKAKRIRKIMGGGMRQAGYMAACGLYAIRYNKERLKQDHEKAKKITEWLKKCSFVKEINEPETNIILFIPSIPIKTMLHYFEKYHLKITLMGDSIRMVTHLDITDQDMIELQDRFNLIDHEIYTSAHIK